MNAANESDKGLMAKRFRGFLPVVVDVETGGLNPQTDALLEIAIVLMTMNDKGELVTGETHAYHVEPFEGANIEKEALEINQIPVHSALRMALGEVEALKKTFAHVRHAIKAHDCKRAVLVGHNAWFDRTFLGAAVARNDIKRDPFHPFTSLDTASIGALTVGQTVLAKMCQAAGIAFDSAQAHSAIYDAQKTADFFCYAVNRWGQLGGWDTAFAQLNDA